MQVSQIWVEDQCREANKHTFQTAIKESTCNLICENICINSEASVRRKKKIGGFEMDGNKTDCGLLLLALKLGSFH